MFVDLNGEKIGEWTGDRNAIGTIEKQGYPTDRRMSLFIGSGDIEFVFHRIRVRMLDGGSVQSLRPVPSTPSVPVATQEPSRAQE